MDYIEKLFEIEKSYIEMSMSHLDDYRKMFGEIYMVSPMLEGVNKSVKNYYSKKDNEYLVIVQKICKILGMMNVYTRQIEKKAIKAIYPGNKLMDSFYSLELARDYYI